MDADCAFLAPPTAAPVTTPSTPNQTAHRSDKWVRLLFSVLVVPVISVVVIQHDANVTSHSDYVPHSVLPDVTNLTLVSTGNTSFTVSWERPKDDFDYYRVEVTGNGSDDVGAYRVGSCANGSIVDAHQTQLTCDHIEPCTNVTFTIRTYARGPPERASSGVTLGDIFVPGQAAPRVNNLALISAENRSFTVSWGPPMDKFDYYRVQVIGNSGVVNVGSCANGTIIDKKHLRVTCDDVEECNNLTFKIRMFLKGPPERGYYSAVLRGIFIPGPVPDSPNNVGIVGRSASLSRLQWQPPENISDNLRDYTVRICHRKGPCDAEQDLTGCVEHRTSDNWFDFETTEGASYCVPAAPSHNTFNARPNRTSFRQMGSPPFPVLVVPVISVVVIQHDANVTSHSDYVPHSVLPDVTNLTLVSTGNTSFTVSWERPKDDFDYYRVDVTGNSSDDVGPYRVGSCANGSIVDAYQTQITCDHIEPCTNVNFTIRTYARGPPERSSSGVTLDEIFVPGQGPGSPGDVSISWFTPDMSRLRWKQPDEVYGTILGYRISICQRNRSCDVGQETDDCEEYRSSTNQWHWVTTRGAQYCVLVSARARCGGQVLTGRPVAAEVVAPFSAVPRVNNLSLVSAENRSFMVSWGPPMDKFDYYRVQVTGNRGIVNVGSCAKGTIIDKNDLWVTCDGVEDCKNLTFQILPGPPNNVGIVGISASLSRLQWETPENISDNLRDYTVRICHRKGPCDAEQDLTGCVEHRTSDKWFDFETTEGASYCAQVKANTVCGDRAITGRPATAAVMAPFLEDKAVK
ncbi:hypothetical protein MTO96_011521 [Rhipicephalus appendiculatus]